MHAVRWCSLSVSARASASARGLARALTVRRSLRSCCMLLLWEPELQLGHWDAGRVLSGCAWVAAAGRAVLAACLRWRLDVAPLPSGALAGPGAGG